jgi:hypothetical protein
MDPKENTSAPKLKITLDDIIIDETSERVQRRLEVTVNDGMTKPYTIKMRFYQLQQLYEHLRTTYRSEVFPFLPSPKNLNNQDAKRQAIFKIQKFFDYIATHEVLQSDRKVQELFLISFSTSLTTKEDLKKNDDLSAVLVSMCNEVSSNEGNILDHLTHQITRVFNEVSQHLLEANEQLQNDVETYTSLIKDTARYTIIYREYLINCNDLLKFTALAVEKRNVQDFKRNVTKIYESVRTLHLDATRLRNQLEDFVKHVELQLEHFKSKKALAKHKQNAIRTGLVSIFVIVGLVTLPLLAVTAPTNAIIKATKKEVKEETVVSTIQNTEKENKTLNVTNESIATLLSKLNPEAIKKIWEMGQKLGHTESALNELKELVQIYSTAVHRIGRQQEHFFRVEKALEEVKKKCDALALLKEDDFEFIKAEFPKQVEMARLKLRGLSEAVRTYLQFLKEKGIFYEVPDVDNFEPF